MCKNNSRESSKFKGYSPLLLLCTSTGNAPQTASILTLERYRLFRELSALKKYSVILSDKKH